LLEQVAKWARKRSPWIYHINASSCNGCDIELVASLTPRYDVERFGAVLVPSPRHADVLVVTGVVNAQTKDRLKRGWRLRGCGGRLQRVL
jgi:Ni,Fe-hydrogenase III small subunit